MVRKFAVALFAASSLSASIAQALGLGEVTVNSSLNQPLDAQIELVNTEGLQPSEIVTALASQEAFRRANIDRSFFLNDVRFKVEWKNTGNAVIRLTSSKPVREPYLNFLVEVNWPSGRLLREYALLIDPPTYSLDNTTSTAPVQAAQTNTSTQQPARQSAPAQTAPATGSQQPARTTMPASSAPQGDAQADAYGPIRSDETMWEIALKTRPNSQITPQQMMLAIQDLNPDAFVNNNINLVKRGQMLRIPDEQTILERDRRDATSEFAVQNEEFEAITGGDTSRSDQMRILADERGTATGSEANSGEGRVTGTSVRASDPVALGEDLAEQTRANAELKSRLDAVQEQLATAQRLVQLKDDELAALQAQLAKQRTQPEGDAASAAGTPDPATQAETPPAGSAGEQAEDAATTQTTDTADAMTGEDPTAPQGEVDPAAEAPTADTEAAGEVAATDPANPDLADPDAEAAAGDMTEGAGDEPEAEAPVLTEEIPVVKPREVQEPVAAEPESLLDQIASNPMYQMALAGGLLLILLLLWAMSRRKANKDAEDYESGIDESANGPSGAAIAASRAGMSRSAADAASDESDPVAAADVYLAYDREDQARQVLEDALEKEPDNQRYRVKLLDVLGMAGATAAMHQAYDRIMAGEDEDAIVEAQTVMNRYDIPTDSHADEADDASLEALEEELRNSSPSPAPAYARTAHPDTEDELSDDDLADVFGESDQSSDRGSRSASDELDELDSDSGYDAAVKTPDSPDNTRDLSFSLDDTSTSGAFDDSDDLDIDFRISDLDLDDADGSPAAVSTNSLEDEADLLDLDTLETVDGDRNGDPRATDFDRSLQAAEAAADEINASLEEPIELDSADDEIDLDSSELDLELSEADEDELADFDLELDEEDTIPTAGPVVDATPADRQVSGDLDDELDLADLEMDDLDIDSIDLDSLDEVSLDEESLDADNLDAEAPMDTTAVATGSTAGLSDEVEAAEAKDLDDDFDFMSDADEAATKLDLARAYLDMGDKDGARDILLEVVEEGSDEQKTEANELLAGL